MSYQSDNEDSSRRGSRCKLKRDPCDPKSTHCIGETCFCRKGCCIYRGVNKYRKIKEREEKLKLMNNSKSKTGGTFRKFVANFCAPDDAIEKNERERDWINEKNRIKEEQQKLKEKLLKIEDEKLNELEKQKRVWDEKYNYQMRVWNDWTLIKKQLKNKSDTPKQKQISNQTEPDNENAEKAKQDVTAKKLNNGLKSDKPEKGENDTEKP
ncbi:hypothetical protein HELRODRAFT_165162 [Helobdella robusta]|uniref:Uncharacterized protein n=1 Tax=Helobdella robusta TaxID=6412 RepID=T1EWC8_HELRO|nr:hypothetical protein HELRODRAFT_165162 [Helobdella robusta]ESN93007.1 hypothetical protein HELRODRAFT_165162 [Helobdella robusta]